VQGLPHGGYPHCGDWSGPFGLFLPVPLCDSLLSPSSFAFVTTGFLLSAVFGFVVTGFCQGLSIAAAGV